MPVGAGRFTVNAPTRWTLKAVYVDGRDVIDFPVDFPGGGDIANVAIVLTDQVTELSGIVRDGQGQALTDLTVIAFSTDSSHWRPQARQIAAARPDQNGRYQIRGLPPGPYFLVAVGSIEQGAWYERALLESLTRDASRLRLRDGETKSFDLDLDIRR